MSDYRFVDGTRLVSVVEALIFSSPDPISWEHIIAIIQQGDENVQLDKETVAGLVDQLNRRYDENDLAFRIREAGGGYTFATRQRFHPWLSIFQHENAYRKLSQSAIETLAIIAYRQPITRPEIDQIRGVDSGYIVRQLLEKMLIRVSGRADLPGRPLLYKTTDHFLRHFGLNSVDELPRPREIEEILRDDDMAEQRKLLLERQLVEQEEDADEILEAFLKVKEEGNGKAVETEMSETEIEASEGSDQDFDQDDEEGTGDEEE